MPRWMLGALAAASLGLAAYLALAGPPDDDPNVGLAGGAGTVPTDDRPAIDADGEVADALGISRALPPAEGLGLTPAPRQGSAPSDLVRRLRGRRVSGPAEDASTAERRLLARRGWIESLSAFDRLPGRDDPRKVLERVTALRGATADSVVDQNLIFHVAIAFPLEVAGPWLRAVLTDADPAAREDALVGLAFAGDPAALLDFERLATNPSAASVRRLIDGWEEFEALARTGGSEVREVLRSYRAIEVLDRVPYFKMTAYLARMSWPVESSLDAETRRRLLVAWLQRWPGHPGSDDVALRIGDLDGARREWPDAAAWYSRAATLPDQDVTASALERLVGVAELMLTTGDIARLLDDRESGRLNRDLLSYVRIRRIAAEQGLEPALAEVERTAAVEPESGIARALALVGSASPPKGLASGLVPLDPEDPIRWTEAEPPPPTPDPAEGVWAIGCVGRRTGQEGAGRLEPRPESVLLDVDRVASQLRVWRTLAELGRRASETRGERRADYLYKIAAVWFHDRDALYPAYGTHSATFAWCMSSLRWHGAVGPEYEAAYRRYERSTFSWLRALAAFERLEHEAPTYAGMDRVLFSEALCWKRLIDYLPYGMGSDDAESRAARGDAMRRAVQALDRCARSFPDSPLADDCLRALSWWRRGHPEAFG